MPRPSDTIEADIIAFQHRVCERLYLAKRNGTKETFAEFEEEIYNAKEAFEGNPIQQAHYNSALEVLDACAQAVWGEKWILVKAMAELPIANPTPYERNRL